MTLLRLLISASIFTAATAFSVDEWENITDINYRLPDNVVPVHYDIKLIPFIEESNFTFHGESSIIVEIQRATKKLKLHSLGLTIDKAATTLIVNSNNDSYAPTNHTYDGVTQILVLSFDNELPPEIYTLNMKFSGVLLNAPRGFYITSYINEEEKTVWLASTYFETTWARQAFPCWDEPALKATFNISIKHNRNYTALSNMPVREQTDDGNDNMIWTHFEKTPIMSTYLVAFVVVSDYVRIPNEDGTVNMWCRPAVAPYVKHPQAVAVRAIGLLAEYTNVTYTLPKIDLAAIPELASIAMENWGLVTYRELSLSYNEELDTVYQKHVVSESVTHEMAHQWFGNLVGPLWWSDVWLSEGFASFFAYYILNQILKDCRIMDHFVVLIQHDALESDVGENIMPITFEVNSQPEDMDSLFSSNIYEKAPCILRMIQHTITEDVFHKGIVKYLHAHQFGSATADNLWNILQEVLDESNVPHSDYKVKEVMDTWIKQRHYPTVHVTLNCETGEVILTQEHFRPQREIQYIDDDKWWIPITFTTQSNPDFSNTVPTQWLRPQDHHVTIKGIDLNDWIIVNLQSMGYYRVNYDLYNWLKISNYLNSDDYVKIHVLNRAQLIDDAYHFLITHQLEVITFVDLIRYYARETDFIAWRPMFVIFERNLHIFKFTQTSCLQAFFAKLLNNLLESTGYEEDPTDDDFTKLNRMSVLRWACTFGHSKCKNMATIKLSEHLANPETHKVSPNLKDWLFCNGLMEANASIWNKFKDIYVKKSDMIFLRYLTCSENPDILINFLNISVSNASVTNNYYKVIYSSIVRRQVNNDLVLDYLLANTNKTMSRGYTIRQIFTGIIYSIYSFERLEKISNYVETNFNNEIFEMIETMIHRRKTDLHLTWSRIVDTFRPPACSVII